MRSNALNIIGITGGVGSGKSTVAHSLAEFGAMVIDADRLCHELLNTEAVKREITALWPEAVDDDSDEINRKRLADIVFTSKEDITRLNGILHPLVIRQIEEKISVLTERMGSVRVVIDAALLEESGLSSICNVIIFVDTELHLRKDRCRKGRKWHSNEIERRERFQISAEAKRRKARFVIDNNGSKSNSANQVRALWDNFFE